MSEDNYDLEEIKEKLDGAGLSKSGFDWLGKGILPTCDPGCYSRCVNCYDGCMNGPDGGFVNI